MPNRQDETPRRVDQPEPGFYVMRLTPRGPWTPAIIRHDSEGWYVFFDNRWLGPSREPWPQADIPFLLAIERVHTGGRTQLNGQSVTESHIMFLNAQRRWAEIYAPDHEAANPRREINLDRRLPF